MDSPFLTNQWSLPSNHRYYYSPSPVPIHRNPTPPRPKVVSVPVRFVDTERIQSDAALKIQSLYRGYLVRKSLQRIAAIGREVDEVQRRVEDAEVVDLLRRESRERLKVNERLMNLLFKLDSVRGIDSGVREYRKKVIRRAIALQEKVDAIVGTEEIEESPNVHGAGDAEDRGECESIKLEAVVDVGVSNASQVDEVEKEEEHLVHGEEEDATTDTAAGERDLSVHDGDHAMAEESDHCIDAVGDAHDKNMEGVDQPMEAATAKQRDTSLGDELQTTDADLHANEEKEDSCADSETGSSLNPESLMDAADENKREDVVNTGEARGGEREKREREIKEERNKELLERMVEDNEKMMALMAELFERNERQTRLLSSLSHRVEQLEKAFVCERLRKKKKRQAACGGRTDGSETFQDSNKCGKR